MTTPSPTDDPLQIGGKTVANRLFVGTGKFASHALMRDALTACGAQVVTVALRRVDPSAGEEDILSFLPEGRVLMPNTSGARTAAEAVRIARLARAAGCGDWIKIEVIDDARHLLPDPFGTLEATEILAKEGFVVLPYINPDLYLARRLRDAGAAAVMPLGAPIGSGRGLKTEEMVRILVDEIRLPVVVDAGLGAPSQACRAMELGCAAVLVNTAIAAAADPVAAAKAFAEAVVAGRRAYRAGLLGERTEASASSPLTGFLGDP